MPTSFPDANPASASPDCSHASARFLEFQAAQACADGDVQAARQALNAALLELPLALAAHINHIFDACLAYAHWANSADHDFLDAQEAAVLATQEHARLASAIETNSPGACDVLGQADEARLAADQALEARALERAIAREELENATAYLDRFRREGNGAVQEAIQDLSDALQHAVGVAQEAQLATQSALAQLQFFLRMAGNQTAEVSPQDAALEDQEFGEDSEQACAAEPSDTADSDDANLLSDCFAGVVGSLPHLQFGVGNSHAFI